MSVLTFETHEQAMACLNCALAGFVPESHFPLEDGLWDQECPRCGAGMVWIAPVRRKDFDSTDAQTDVQPAPKL